MKRRGFTLIELLIVIAIIGILATIIFLNLSNAAEKSKYTKVKSELKTIDDAVSLAFASSTTGDLEENTMTGSTIYWDDFAESTHTGYEDLAPDAGYLTFKKYDKENLADISGREIIEAYPTPPDPLGGENGFGGYNGTYKLYIENSYNHAAGIETPEKNDLSGGAGSVYWCVYKAGSFNIGNTGVEKRGGGEVIGEERYCNPGN